jgi:hypothetical protein
MYLKDREKAIIDFLSEKWRRELKSSVFTMELSKFK